MTLRLLLAVMLVPSCVAAQTAKPNLYFFVDTASFSAEGTWIPINPKSQAVYQAETQLDCIRRTSTCIEATADYFSGHPHISLVYFRVIKWDGNGIVASSDDAICVTRTLTVGFATKHVSDVKETKEMPQEKQKACESLGVIGSEAWSLALKNSKAWTVERNRQHME